MTAAVAGFLIFLAAIPCAVALWRELPGLRARARARRRRGWLQ
jgi:hypothetical protein